MSDHPKTETIVFAGGCFWCMEAVFQLLKGVDAVVSGYAGGKMPSPTYEAVSGGATGHAEVVQVTFDPSIIQLENLLAVFFTTHDPTQLNRQGNDVGEQYRSAIYFTKPEQKMEIEKFITALVADKTFSKPIVTEIQPLDTFYPAEKHHQNYYRSNQDQPYCQAVINPKISKLRQKFTPFFKPEMIEK